MRTHPALALVMTMTVFGATSASAQSDPNTNQWAHGTALGAFVGGASGLSRTGAAVGGIAGWELSRWTTIEARGTWFDPGRGADAFGATINAIVNVVPRETITPFVAAGFGLHHASFDASVASMPAFYRDRTTTGSGSATTTRAFTDPVFTFGAGVDVLVKRYVSVRPEAGVLLVRGNGRTATLATFGVRLAYRFEHHPVTP